VVCFQRRHLPLAALRACQSSARERKTDAPAQRISGLFLAYFCFCNGKCVASCCSCRLGCAGMRRIFPRVRALYSGGRSFSSSTCVS
jgi:hypothetical protein